MVHLYFMWIYVLTKIRHEMQVFNLILFKFRAAYFILHPNSKTRTGMHRSIMYSISSLLRLSDSSGRAVGGMRYTRIGECLTFIGLLQFLKFLAYVLKGFRKLYIRECVTSRFKIILKAVIQETNPFAIHKYDFR